MSGTELPFVKEDVDAVLNVIRPVAEEISGRLAELEDKLRLEAPTMVDAEVAKHEKK